MNLTTLPLDRLRTDGGTQLRVQPDPHVVRDYAAAMQRGDVFPAVVVFTDGEEYWVGDGHHRLEAARLAGRKEITAEVREGAHRDAVLHAAAANAQHGLRRTRADKRNAVLTLLQDPEWREWGDREIARRTGVNHELVGRLRTELSGGNRQIASTVRRGDTIYQQLRPAAGLAPTPAVARLDAQPQSPGAPASSAPPGWGALASHLAVPVPPRAIYPEEWLRAGSHRLYCGSLGAERFQHRVPSTQLVLAVVQEAEVIAGAAEIEGLLRTTDRVAVLTTAAALPALTRKLITPHQRVIPLLYEGAVSRLTGTFERWSPLLFLSQFAPVHPEPDLLRVPEPPRKLGAPLRPSAEVLRALLERFTVPGDTVLAVGQVEVLLLLAQLSDRVCVGVDADVRRLGTALARWERLTGERAEVLVR